MTTGAAPQGSGYGISRRTARPRAAAVSTARRTGRQVARPMWLVIAGGAVAIGGGLGLLVTSVNFWFIGDLPQADAVIGLAAWGVVYVVGIVGFSFGWEMFDTEKAVRLALVLAVLGVLSIVAVLLVARLLVLLLGALAGLGKAGGGGGNGGNGGGGGGSSSSSPDGGKALGGVLGKTSSSGTAGTSSADPGSGGASFLTDLAGSIRGGARRTHPETEPDDEDEVDEKRKRPPL